jgi:hypothetical protein
MVLQRSCSIFHRPRQILSTAFVFVVAHKIFEKHASYAAGHFDGVQVVIPKRCPGVGYPCRYDGRNNVGVSSGFVLCLVNLPSPEEKGLQDQQSYNFSEIHDAACSYLG